MIKYIKPKITEEEIELEDVIAESNFGEELPGDQEGDFDFLDVFKGI